MFISKLRRLFQSLYKNKHIGSDNVSVRERWLQNNLLKIPKGKRILDAGAGELKYKKFCSHLDYVSQDFGNYDGKGDGSGLQTNNWDNSKLDIVSDITQIPEPDASFDAIMCIEVFEHLPNPILALKEFFRLLKKNGKLIITAPFASLVHFAPFHFYSGFSSYFYKHHFPKLGFDIKELKSNGNYFKYLAQEIRRIPTISYQTNKKSPRFYENFCMHMVLHMLERLSNQDKNSQQLLNFGYNVLAEKK